MITKEDRRRGERGGGAGDVEATDSASHSLLFPISLSRKQWKKRSNIPQSTNEMAATPAGQRSERRGQTQKTKTNKEQ